MALFSLLCVFVPSWLNFASLAFEHRRAVRATGCRASSAVWWHKPRVVLPSRPMRIALLLLFAALISAAEPFSLAKLSVAAKDLTTMRVTFVQEKHLAILDEPVISPGVIEISKPLSAVRWEYTGKSVLLFKDGRLRRFGAEGKEESIGSKDQGVNSLTSQMKAFLNGDWSAMEEMFTITPAADGIPQLLFAPKTPDLARYITSLTIRWRDDLTAPQLMTLIAAGDDRTEYRYDPPQLAIDLPAVRFEKP